MTNENKIEGERGGIEILTTSAFHNTWIALALSISFLITPYLDDHLLLWQPPLKSLPWPWKGVPTSHVHVLRSATHANHSLRCSLKLIQHPRLKMLQEDYNEQEFLYKIENRSLKKRFSTTDFGFCWKDVVTEKTIKKEWTTRNNSNDNYNYITCRIIF